jgi:uncharacterized protein
MRFNPKARLDRSQVQVRRGGARGRRATGGAPIPLPGGVGTRSGGVILLIVVVAMVALGLTGNLGDVFSGGSAVPPRSDSEPVSTSELTECETGVDANENPDCARLAVVNSIQAFWSDALPQQANREYVETDTVIFTGSVDTGCGPATSAVGPFYCPTRDDMQVYLDTSFFDAMLEGELGARGGDFAEAYVLAHEYGHHIENLLGYLGRARTQQGPNSDAVRIELMADCLAGMWARYATTVEGEDGEVLIEELTDEDISEALDAAAAVGDDRIQEKTSGRVTPENWTHGSAAAREMWFRTGLEEGSLDTCDTFSTDRLYPS